MSQTLAKSPVKMGRRRLRTVGRRIGVLSPVVSPHIAKSRAVVDIELASVIFIYIIMNYVYMKHPIYV